MPKSGPRGTANATFWSHVDTSGDCWVWTGAKTSTGARAGMGGYGKWGSTMAHRVSYEALVAPIPAGLQLDHLCENPPCVNPAHLEPVTGLENLRRWQERNPFCKRGHSLTGDNLRISYRNGRPNRICRTCRRETNRRCKQRPPVKGQPGAMWLTVVNAVEETA